MNYFLKNHTYKNAVEEILITLFPEDRPHQVMTEEEFSLQEDSVLSSLVLSGGAAHSRAVIFRGGVKAEGRCTRSLAGIPALKQKSVVTYAVKTAIYRAACRLLPEKPACGAMTGVRPVKALRELMGTHRSDAAALSAFAKKYDVSPEKSKLAYEAALAASKADRVTDPADFCLYIGIPFCPTRCSYCSFVSNSVEKSGALIEPFVEALLREITYTGGLLQSLGRRICAVYFGGGTPTTLSAAQLDRIMIQIERSFDLSALREYTVEAGRPDTITAEKLDTLYTHGVRRLSINPQTMNDDVLKRIGRSHTAAQVVSAYEMARSLPFDSINMDLIVGLPGDSLNSFTDTMNQVISMHPENITVHTLAIKRGSRMHEDSAYAFGGKTLGEMITVAGQKLRAAGYGPYYLYRQKYMLSSAENTGWAKAGKEILYNIYIMEELLSILALGAGAATKLLEPSSGRIERIFNPKYPKEYIENIGAILTHKNDLSAFVREGG